jgi:hypothetical protein
MYTKRASPFKQHEDQVTWNGAIVEDGLRLLCKQSYHLQIEASTVALRMF